MISFFRLNDPYRLLAVLILLVLLRLPALLGSVPLLQSELEWMLVGENLSAGDTLYRDVWSSLAPLSGGIYWLLDLLFGRSQLAYQLLAILLLTVQAGIFNLSLLSYKVLKESSFVPALFYAVLGSFFFDAYSLSPVLISLTFLLLAQRRLTHMIAGGGTDETIFFLGFYSGLAMLAWLPAFFLLFAYLFTLLTFTGTKPRQYLLLIIGFFLPVLSVGLYYGWKMSFGFFNEQYLAQLSFFGGAAYMPLLSIAAIALLPAVLLLLGVLSYLNARGFNNYQVRVQQSYFYTLLMGLLAFFMSADKSAFHLLILLPVAAFYIAHYFSSFRHNFIAELAFLAFLLVQLGFSYSLLYKWFPEVQPYVQVEGLYTKDRPEQELVRGRRILSLSDDLSLYREANLATPYLEWRYSRTYLTNLQYYDNLLAVYQTFEEELPEVLIDDAGIAPALFERMPTIGQQYRPSADFAHVYLLDKTALTDR